MRYPVVVHKDPDSDYGVTVPDVPGCFSAGETLDEALTQVVEAIEGHLEGLLMDEEPIPLPKSIEFHRNNPDYEDGVWALVMVDLSKLSGKIRRVNITLPERLLSLMDNYAAQHGETRSGLITQAAIEYLARHSE
ncbi:MAG TPA: type II toxin-antitoxin system HicB family antitoxin [Anaerolineae bacterium]|nr:type II toxin-antitoxin system HicB family antitoxin [Anaerolineae bacterium]